MMADGGGIAVLVATAAAAVASVQAWIAHRKLKFDLFAKRFETYEGLNDAINARRDELAHRDPDQIEIGTSDALRAIWRHQRLMRVLFPIDVAESLTRIDEALLAYSIVRTDLSTFKIISPPDDKQLVGELHRAFMDAERNLFHAQEELALRVTPYLRQYGWVEDGSVKGRYLVQLLWSRTRRTFSERGG